MGRRGSVVITTSKGDVHHYSHIGSWRLQMGANSLRRFSDDGNLCTGLSLCLCLHNIDSAGVLQAQHDAIRNARWCVQRVQPPAMIPVEIQMWCLWLGTGLRYRCGARGWERVWDPMLPTTFPEADAVAPATPKTENSIN